MSMLLCPKKWNKLPQNCKNCLDIGLIYPCVRSTIPGASVALWRFYCCWQMATSNWKPSPHTSKVNFVTVTFVHLWLRPQNSWQNPDKPMFLQWSRKLYAIDSWLLFQHLYQAGTSKASIWVKNVCWENIFKDLSAIIFKLQAHIAAFKLADHGRNRSTLQMTL